MENRNLNIGYATEVLNGRLNGSSPDVERSNMNENTTFVKKINGRGTVSAQCQKFNIRRFMEVVDGFKENERIMIQKGTGENKENSRIEMTPDAFNYAQDDIFGYMMAVKSTTITKEEYDQLSEEEKKFYKEKGKGKKLSYEKKGSGTSKRKSNFLMSHMTSVSKRSINKEWCVASSTNGGTLPITIETTSGVFVGIANINIKDIGTYKISDDGQFRDYSEDEAELKKIRDLTKEEKFERIRSALRGLEYLSIQGNQNNYLTDTKPKFVILGEYKWGNNVFQGVFKENGIDIELLKETLEENEEFRISNIWIGVNKFADEKYNDIKDIIIKEFEGCDFIKVSNVKNAFDSYLEYLEQTL